MLLRNAWYIAAWTDEIGSEPLARRICNEPVVLFRDGAGKAGALADRCCHRAAPLHHGQRRRGRHPMRLSWPRIRRLGALRRHPRAEADPRGRAGALLSGGREGPVRVDLDGRPGPRRSRRDRRFSLSQRPRPLAQQARCLRDQGQLHADGRQSDGPDASRLSPRQDRRRQSGGACRCPDEDDADTEGSQIHPLAEELGRRRRATSRRRGSRAASTAASNSSSSRRRASCNGPARPMPAPRRTTRNATSASSFGCFTV